MKRREFFAASAMGALAAPQASKSASGGTYYHLGRCASYAPPAVLNQPTGHTIEKIETCTKGGTVAFVRVIADDGSDGWGQVSTYDADVSAELVHRKIARFFLGEDPASLDSLVDRAIEANYKYPWSYVCRALSGVETAVWDWFGKRENKPVCELFGGAPRPLPVYGSSMSRSIKPGEEGERLKRLRDEKGYRAFKIRVGSVNGRDSDQWPGRTEAIIPAVRKAVGGDVELLADANSCYTPPKAIEVGRLMQDHGYIQFEEPCPYWELEWTREVADALSMDVSGGEQDNDLAQWRRMIAMRAVDVVQPDLLYLGGMLRGLRVAAMAGEAGLSCVPHSANLAMVTVYTLHLFAAIPNAGRHVEFSIESTPWADGLYQPELKVIDGEVAVPDGPGWGVEINPEWIAGAERRVSEA